MNPTQVAIRAGFARGWTEFKQVLVSSQDLWNLLFFPVGTLVAMFFMRNASVPGVHFSLGAQTMPGVLGMQVMLGGMIGVAAALMVEREDGTLLRAKATPNGMLGYLVGKIVSSAGGTLIGILIVFVPGVFLLDGLVVDGAGVLTMVWVLVLGLVATMPVGAILGSLGDNPRNLGLIMLPTMGLVAISGIFYPITAMPQWLQTIAQAFPMYWLGLGMRSALLPGALAAAEIGDSWRHWETVGVLGAWGVLGLLVAPRILRRMARGESGSRVAARRERAMQRVQ
jgi:ABC-2 type transport system permease protein